MGYKNQFKRKTRRIATSPNMQVAIGFRSNQKSHRRTTLSANETEPNTSAVNNLKQQLLDLQNKNDAIIAKLKEKQAKQLREIDNRRRSSHERNLAGFEKNINKLKEEHTEALSDISAQKVFLEEDLEMTRRRNLILSENIIKLKASLEEKESEIHRLKIRHKTLKVGAAHRQSLLLTTVRDAAAKNKALSEKITRYEQSKFKLLYRKFTAWLKNVFNKSSKKRKD